MKKIALALGYLFLATPAFAQFVNLQKCGVENVGTGVFSHRETCEHDTGSLCVPYPGGFCQGKSVIDEEVNDKPLYGSKLNVTDCVDELACEELRSTLCHDIAGSYFFYAMKSNNGHEAYCTNIIGYTKVKTGKKLLVEDEQKLRAYLKTISDKKDADDAKKLAKEALKEKLKALKKSDLSSNAKTVDALFDLIEAVVKE